MDFYVPSKRFADEPVLENVLPRMAVVYVCAACENGAMWPFPLPEDKARFSSEIKIKVRFSHIILYFARLALSLDKISFASEIKIKVRFSRFYFVFRSTCIISG